MPEYVRITDVSPRDGLQNEPGVIPTEAKLELIDALFDTGVDEIEITSFVSPKWIPQLADASEVCAGVRGLLEKKGLSPIHFERGPVKGTAPPAPSPSGRGLGRGAKSDSFHYPHAPKPPGATDRARSLRKNMTGPEKALWSRLRADQFLGLRFRRQHPIGPYIVDFYCPAARLVIELDGRSHDGSVQYQDDLIRERFLYAEGLEVLRFNNDDALQRIDDVLSTIERQIKKTPLPSPPPEGEGVRSPVLSALVPNETGFARFLAARQAGVPLDKIALFTAASETFNKKNLNTTFTGTMQRFAPIIARASCPIRGYVSCAIACPFEGPIDPIKVHACAFHLYDYDVDEIDLGDTIGAGTPDTVTKLLETVFTRMKEEDATPIITLHLHDTFGRAADCVKAALDCGVRSFDGSVAGLGGCPYASTPGKRAPGNIATETLVRTIEDAGFRTGVDLDALARAGEVARRVVSESRSVGEGPLTRLGSAETPSRPRGEGGRR